MTSHTQTQTAPPIFLSAYTPLFPSSIKAIQQPVNKMHMGAEYTFSDGGTIKKEDSLLWLAVVTPQAPEASSQSAGQESHPASAVGAREG